MSFPFVGILVAHSDIIPFLRFYYYCSFISSSVSSHATMSEPSNPCHPISRNGTVYTTISAAAPSKLLWKVGVSASASYLHVEHGPEPSIKPPFLKHNKQNPVKITMIRVFLSFLSLCFASWRLPIPNPKVLTC